MLFNPRNAAQLLVFISGSDASEIPLMMKSFSMGGSNGRRMLEENDPVTISLNNVDFEPTEYKPEEADACKKRPGGHHCEACFPKSVNICVICKGLMFASFEGECKCPAPHILFNDECLPDCPAGFRVKLLNDGARSCEEETMCGFWMTRNEGREDCDPNWRFYTLIGVTVGFALLCIIFMIALCCYSGGFYRAIARTHEIAKNQVVPEHDEMQSQSEGDVSFKTGINKDEEQDEEHTNNSNCQEREERAERAVAL